MKNLVGFMRLRITKIYNYFYRIYETRVTKIYNYYLYNSILFIILLWCSKISLISSVFVLLFYIDNLTKIDRVNMFYAYIFSSNFPSKYRH
jgi:hypothetical protein